MLNPVVPVAKSDEVPFNVVATRPSALDVTRLGLLPTNHTRLIVLGVEERAIDDALELWSGVHGAAPNSFADFAFAKCDQ